MSDANVARCKALVIKNRLQLACFGQCRCMGQDFAVVFSAKSANEWKQRKHSRIGRTPERQRRQRVRSPSETAYDVSGVATYRTEGCIQSCAPDRIVDDIESGLSGEGGDVFVDRDRLVVDRHGSKTLNDISLSRRDCGKNLCAECPSNLDCGMANSARSTMNQDLLIGTHVGSVDQTFP